MTDYTGATLIGDETEALLEPADTGRLVDALDELLEILDDEYRMAPMGPDLDALELEISELRGLRDAIHSVVIRATDP